MLVIVYIYYWKRCTFTNYWRGQIVTFSPFAGLSVIVCFTFNAARGKRAKSNFLIIYAKTIRISNMAKYCPMQLLKRNVSKTDVIHCMEAVSKTGVISWYRMPVGSSEEGW